MPQLHELFSDESAIPAPTRPVPKFRAKIKNPQTGQDDLVDIKCAVFALLDDVDTREALRDVEKTLREEYAPKNGEEVSIPIPDKARRDAESYALLFRALRVSDKPTQRLTRTMLELQHAIPPVLASQLLTAYNEWQAAEFPDVFTAAALQALEADAEGK